MTITFKGIADPGYTLVVDDKHVISYTRPVLVVEDVKVESFNFVSYYKRPRFKDVVILLDANAPQVERLFGLQIARQLSIFEQTGYENIKPYKFDTSLEFDFEDFQVTDQLQGCFISDIQWIDLDVVGEQQQIQIILRYDNYTP